MTGDDKVVLIIGCAILVMFVVLIIRFLKRNPRTSENYPTINTQPIKDSRRAQVSDVKSGEVITIEWSKIKGGIGKVLCVNNDPETKKILVSIRWNNYQELGGVEIEQKILDYHHCELRNFHLLNSKSVEEKENSENDSDIATLHKKMNEALEKEEYELADELQKKIDKLNKK